jgi:hypothetical protein
MPRRLTPIFLLPVVLGLAAALPFRVLGDISIQKSIVGWNCILLLYRDVQHRHISNVSLGHIVRRLFRPTVSCGVLQIYHRSRRGCRRSVSYDICLCTRCTSRLPMSRALTWLFNYLMHVACSRGTGRIIDAKLPGATRTMLPVAELIRRLESRDFSIPSMW